MIFGALIVGAGAGFVAMVIAFAAGASLLSALAAYWLVGCLATVAVCAAKLLFCRTAPADPSGRSA